MIIAYRLHWDDLPHCVQVASVVNNVEDEPYVLLYCLSVPGVLVERTVVLVGHATWLLVEQAWTWEHDEYDYFECSVGVWEKNGDNRNGNLVLIIDLLEIYTGMTCLKKFCPFHCEDVNVFLELEELLPKFVGHVYHTLEVFKDCPEYFQVDLSVSVLYMT